MKKGKHIQYYVEGEDEKKLVDTLKTNLRLIEPGKTDIFNTIQKRFTLAQIRPLKQNTIVVLVYDTDVEETDILQQNISFLNKQKAISEVLCIPQVNNLEDELLRSCQIKKITDLTHSPSLKDYKRDLIKCSNLNIRLQKCKFDITKFWSSTPSNLFHHWGNDAHKIKLLK